MFGVDDWASLDVARGPNQLIPYRASIVAGNEGPELVYNWQRACVVIGLFPMVQGPAAWTAATFLRIVDQNFVALVTDGQEELWEPIQAMTGGATNEFGPQWYATRIQVRELDTWTIQFAVDPIGGNPTVPVLLSVRIADPIEEDTEQ